ncbi:hypothetical protein NH340_JMT03831 [Sarcoptes scabiei]|nr:hypothetical protein NH340_JMT03831 [Sarcoptes scabiei]
MKKLQFTLENSFDCNQGAIRKTILNVDGEYCLTCGSNKTIKLWKPRSKLLLQTYSGHGFEVMDVDSTPDSSQLISGSLDKTIILWDVSTAKPLRRIRAHIGAVNCVKFNEDASVFISASIDGMIKIWDNKSNARDPIQILDEAKDSISYLTLTDHEIVSVSLDQNVRHYDIRKGMMNADCLHASLSYVTMTDNGECILLSCLNNSLILLDKSSGEILATFKGHRNEKYRCDNGFMENDSLIVSGSEDGTICVWSLLEGTIQSRIQHPHKVVHTFAINQKQKELISCTENKLYLWTFSNET